MSLQYIEIKVLILCYKYYLMENAVNLQADLNKDIPQAQMYSFFRRGATRASNSKFFKAAISSNLLKTIFFMKIVDRKKKRNVAIKVKD